MHALLLLLVLHAATIGVSKPAPSITPARIAVLPAADRAAWAGYLDRSSRQEQTDRAVLAAERRGVEERPPSPKESNAAHSIPLRQDAAFYHTPEARKIADNIVSFQTPSGGWSKNLDLAAGPRQPGQSFTANNISHFLGPDDFDAPRDPEWNYVGTLDNDATNTELRYLARMSTAFPGRDGEAYRASFLKGIEYLLHAQFPNGGWPQVWPLEGGYHDAVTYNDNAVTEAADVLTHVADAQGDYGFVPLPLRHEAAAAASHALECILRTQIVLNGKRTLWPQQADALTLAPVSGRNFEPEALATGESSDMLVYLMRLPHPAPAVRQAVDAGVLWLKEHAIQGFEWTGGRQTPGGRHLAPAPGAGPLWARYYSLDTQKPVFGDRDKTIHDTVDDLTLERRNGYAWYSGTPQEAIDAYASWKPSLPPKKSR